VNAPFVRFPVWLAAELACSFTAPASRGSCACGSLSAVEALRQQWVAAHRPARAVRALPASAPPARACHVSRLEAQGSRQSQSWPRDRARQQKLRALLSFPSRSASRTVVAMHCQSALNTSPSVIARCVGVGWQEEIALAWVAPSVRPTGGPSNPMRPNPSIEQTSKKLRFLYAAHVKR
jgi:hypothetical protein